KNLGERAIKAASRMSIADKSLKILRANGYLLIPIKGPLSEEQINEIRGEIPQFEMLVQSFPKREERARSILDFLEDRMPPHLLASLPRSIDFIGDVAILEIPDELVGYRQLIGEAVLLTFKRVKSVLAKSSGIRGVYRIREYEVIAGSEDTETVHKEYGCIYYLDPRKVYFSPRLSYEHYRVASQVREGETVIDMFAGVGPFSILIAKMHANVKVYAIDINPDAVGYLEKNIYANGVYGRVTPVLGDAREIIENNLKGSADRVIMNLPEKSVEYVDAACAAVKKSGGIIHYYRFAEGSHAAGKVRTELIRAIEGSGRSVEALLSERIMKEVAPFKWQIVIDTKIQ
ncbi:class I SAM-dependent methyltransferase family protein, partial [Candidatus Bathyarchaeota archaeon]|nr:class I SAM-dependent methyltransferase family protein [Candidatus Bathyarchaeota archaeon]